MGSGGLAMLIPPSGIAVLLAAVGEISIGKLLIAGVIPGLLLACFYATYIIVRCKLQPSIAPPYEVTAWSLSEKFKDTVLYVLPLGIILFLVLGLIFLGIATPTESAAVGALGSIFLAAAFKNMNWEVMKKCILGALHVTVMTLMIITAATTYSQILAFSGATQGLIGLATNLSASPILIVAAMQVILLILGWFMCMTSMIMIAVPIYMPIINALGVDPVWFGILFVMNMEMAYLTPPFGFNLFYMKGVAPKDTSMGDIYRSVIPFVLLQMFALALVMVFPAIALWLPNKMY